jgi:hypothetical protein
MDTVTRTPAAPTSAATTRRTEPEVVAGISSGEGQAAGYAFESVPATRLSGLLVCGAAAVFGLAAGFGLIGWRRG